MSGGSMSGSTAAFDGRRVLWDGPPPWQWEALLPLGQGGAWRFLARVGGGRVTGRKGGIEAREFAARDLNRAVRELREGRRVAHAVATACFA